jgi:hypothetical protein
VALGFFYAGVDYEEAIVTARAADDVARKAREAVEPGSNVWFAGRWGFRYHAERAGLMPVATGRTVLEPGDVLVVQENQVVEEPRIAVDPAQAPEVATLTYDGPRLFPRLRTVPAYYAGKNPLERQSGPRFVAHVYRVEREFTPLGLIPPWLGPKDRAVGALREIGRARR